MEKTSSPKSELEETTIVKGLHQRNEAETKAYDINLLSKIFNYHFEVYFNFNQNNFLVHFFWFLCIVDKRDT